MNAAKDIIDDAVLERPIVWFEVFAVSDEFMRIVRDMPEIWSASSVRCSDGRCVEGPKEVFVIGSAEELEERLPNIVRHLATSGNTNILVVRKATRCTRCARDRAEHPEKSVVRCPHSGPTLNSAFAVDVSKYPGGIRHRIT